MTAISFPREESGHYKPDPRPYQLALQRLGVAADDAAFVAGSGYDLIGTSAVGLRSRGIVACSTIGVDLPTPDAVDFAAVTRLIEEGLRRGVPVLKARGEHFV
jgi:FMN phosphatase YigB (HAD superfamily)